MESVLTPYESSRSCEIDNFAGWVIGAPEEEMKMTRSLDNYEIEWSIFRVALLSRFRIDEATIAQLSLDHGTLCHEKL